MWLIETGVRTVRRFIAGPSEQRERNTSGSRGVDWLPPVLGPEDWSIGLLADRSAGWYFERH